MAGKLRVLRHLPVLAMDRHEVAWPDQVQHQLQLFAGTVPRDMHGRIHGAGDDFATSPGDVIQHPADRLLIAGDHPGTQNDDVARVEREVLVVIHGDARIADIGSPCVPETTTTTSRAAWP